MEVFNMVKKSSKKKGKRSGAAKAHSEGNALKAYSTSLAREGARQGKAALKSQAQSFPKY
jgi:hypothetical protein